MLLILILWVVALAGAVGMSYFLSKSAPLWRRSDYYVLLLPGGRDVSGEPAQVRLALRYSHKNPARKATSRDERYRDYDPRRVDFVSHGFTPSAWTTR